MAETVKDPSSLLRPPRQPEHGDFREKFFRPSLLPKNLHPKLLNAYRRGLEVGPQTEVTSENSKVLRTPRFQVSTSNF